MDTTTTTANKVRQVGNHDDINLWTSQTFKSGHKKTLHVHFIDYDTPQGSNVPLLPKLAKDLKTISAFTDGVIITCGGQGGPQKYIPRILGKLVADPNITDFKVDKPNPRSLLIGVGSKIEDSVRNYLHHVLLLKVPEWLLDGALDEEKRADSIRDNSRDLRNKFLLELRDLPRDTLVKGDDQPTPVVCVLTEGGIESLNAAATALDNKIPIIIMKGHKVLNKLAELQQTVELIRERRRSGHEIVSEYVPQADKAMVGEITQMLNDPSAESLITKIIRNIHLMAVYNPVLPTTTFSQQETTVEEEKCLDAVILEVLIINKKEKEINIYLQAVMRNRKAASNRPGVNTLSACFIDDKNLQWDYFIKSLKDGGAAAVKAFLGCLQLDCDDFHFGKLLDLYDCKTGNYIRRDVSIDTQLNIIDRRVIKFYQARRDLKKYLGRPSDFPLHCMGLGCPHCNFDIADLADEKDVKAKSKEYFWQTCLHPVQELFLWSLLCSNSEVTISLLEYTHDRMAAALFARAVYGKISKRERKHRNLDLCTQLDDDFSRFEQVVTETLHLACQVAEMKASNLLTKPCSWWSPKASDYSSSDLRRGCFVWWADTSCKELTTLDVAMLTGCKAFMALPLCQQLVDQRWKNKQTAPAIQEDQDETPEQQDRSRIDRVISVVKSPIFRFSVCIVWQLCFLLLYSYVLLRGLTGSLHLPHLVLVVWVADIAAEEIRQFISVDGSLKNKAKTYFRPVWNVLDACSVGTFFLGTMLAFWPHPDVHTAGRVVIAISLFFFILRFLQVLIVFSSLGLWLVMSAKLVKDTLWFMVIVFFIMLAYAVASESLLIPENTWGLRQTHEIPYRAFFSMFGEFFLDEINSSKEVGVKVVPVLLAIFVIMTNILLFNLLIAHLSNRYSKMEEKAEEIQAWQKCQLVMEFQTRSPFPPPCNLLFLWLLLPRCYSCWRRHHSPAVTPTVTPTTAQQSVPLLPVGSEVDIDIEMYGTCLYVKARDKTQTMDITVTTKTASNFTQKNTTYRLHKKIRRLIVWKADPTFVIEVRWGDSASSQTLTDSQLSTDQHIYVDYEKLNNFEREQAEWAITQQGKKWATTQQGIPAR